MMVRHWVKAFLLITFTFGILGKSPSQQPHAPHQPIAPRNGAALAGHSLLLQPYTTTTIPLVDLPNQSGSLGGIHISYDGAESGLDVNGGLENLQTGYSANLPFVPVASPASSLSMVESTVAQLSLMNGSQNSEMHLPSNTVFTPYSIAHNLSDAPLTVTPEIWWMADSVPHRQCCRP